MCENKLLRLAGYRNEKSKKKHLKLVRKEKASLVSRHVPWSQLLWRVLSEAVGVRPVRRFLKETKKRKYSWGA